MADKRIRKIYTFSPAQIQAMADMRIALMMTGIDLTDTGLIRYALKKLGDELSVPFPQDVDSPGNPNLKKDKGE